MADADEPLPPRTVRDLYRAVSTCCRGPEAMIYQGVYYVRHADGTVSSYPLLVPGPAPGER
jgi:hypothetical protein